MSTKHLRKERESKVEVVTNFFSFTRCEFSFLKDGSKSQEYFVDALCPLIEWIDFEYTLQSQKVDQSFSLKDLIDFALENLSSKHESTCVIAATILRKLTRGLIVLDKAAMIKNNSEDDTGKNYLESMENTSWHVLEDFKDVLEEFRIVMTHFVEDFK